MSEVQGFDITRIMDCIPHRYPFLLVDKVLDYKEGEWIKALKNVTINEPFFQGHFPGDPIMPGVLMLEALAQTGGVLCFLCAEKKSNLAYFMTIDNAKFRKLVRPGDQLIFDVKITNVKAGKMVKTHGRATVEGKTVCQADLMFLIVEKD